MTRLGQAINRDRHAGDRVTQAEEILLRSLPAATVIAAVVLFMSQCSDPLADDKPRSSANAQQLIENVVPARYRVSDCRYVRDLAFPDDEFSCLVSGRCEERLKFSVPRGLLLDDSPK